MNLSSSFLILLFCGLAVVQGTIETNAMTEKLNSLEIKMLNIESRLENYENRILQLEQKERNTAIFSAGIGGNSPFGPFNTDVTTIYNHTFVNIGNAYSPVTGVFTAPVSGVYFFTIFSLSGGEHSIRLLLYKNNEVISHIHDHRSTDTADNGGNAGFYQLQQGDTVYVRLKEGTHVYKSRTGTTFSGFLVKQNS
ncbi:complement C1q tumor necrosis factor-related protein 3-like [Simochromis diagramma]|uniref:complement C1q tumor necrosis factor-related protein 3-like n=1 Tax=Simochromis diagramma TaxID=43689 RepID=UPI001A7EBEA8|nr:complement C1q tumor necrosis factor-related protein 3-like [Simochromis diagramma]